MKFAVENEAFAKALTLVKSCIPGRNTMPILAHVAVEAKGGEVSIRATNMDREAEARIPAEISEEGAVALLGEILAALTRRLLKGGQSEIVAEGDRARLTSGASKYDLRALPVDDFPERFEFPEGATRFSVPAPGLRGLLETVLYAVDPKDTRAYCKGPALYAGGPRLVAMGTNGLRLAEASIELPKGAAGMPRVVIPAESAKAIVEVLTDVEGDVELAVASSRIEIELFTARLSSALVDSVPIDYRQLFPKQDIAATVRPYALTEALNRATVVYLGEKNSPDAGAVGFEIKDGAIKIDAGIRGNDLCVETIDAETNGHDLSFALEGRFLSEMLATWPETVTVSLHQAAPGGPVLFTSKEKPEAQHMIMPRRR